MDVSPSLPAFTCIHLLSSQESDIQEIMGPVLSKMFVDEAGMSEVFAVTTPAFNNWQR